MRFPATPRAGGRTIFHEDYGNITPPQVMGTKKLVAGAVSKKVPTESDTASFGYNEPGLLFENYRYKTYLVYRY